MAKELQDRKYHQRRVPTQVEDKKWKKYKKYDWEESDVADE